MCIAKINSRYFYYKGSILHKVEIKTLLTINCSNEKNISHTVQCCIKKVLDRLK